MLAANADVEKQVLLLLLLLVLVAPPRPLQLATKPEVLSQQLSDDRHARAARESARREREAIEECLQKQKKKRTTD